MDARTKISDAIELIEDMLELKSPRDYSVEEFRQGGLTEVLFGGMLYPETRTFHFGINSNEHMFYHEAAHWVLINNDLLFRDKSAFSIFGWALDEILAELCANTLDGRVLDHIITDYDEFQKNVLETMKRNDEFKMAAAAYLHENDETDPNVKSSALQLYYQSEIAYFSLRIMELEETLHKANHMLADEYAEFKEEWKEKGNVAIERGVVGMVGERVGATLFEKGHRPKNILDEIRKETLLAPMQMYWQVIVPKL